MGDDATVQARPRLSPTVSMGPGGGAPLGDIGDLDKKLSPPVRTLGAVSRHPRPYGAPHPPHAGTPFAGTPPGTALERKKSYHPDLRADADSTLVPREIFVLPRDGGHKMELIHLNRTCTSVNLASTAPGHGPRLRSASDANLTDEEKVHRVRHQVSFAQDVGVSAALGGPSLQCQQLMTELRCRLQATRQDDPDLGVHTVLEDDSDQEHAEEDVDSCLDAYGLEDDSFLDNATGRSPDSDVDYLAVRPSLASTQLNEVRGPN